jgi:hypothetical protein
VQNRHFCEPVALATDRERKGENGEGDSNFGNFRGCWKFFFCLFLFFKIENDIKDLLELLLGSFF